MTGVVRGREALVKFRVVGPDGRKEQIEAVIDTGSTGWLTLPARYIQLLGLPRKGTVRAQLADGSEAVLAVFTATVIWNRRRLSIDVEQSESTPLIGMSLLSGFELTIQVRPRGRVSIKPLSAHR